MDRVLAFFAFAVFVVFLGVLLVKVPRIDLGIVIVFTVILTAYDFLTSVHKKLPKPVPVAPGEAMDRPTE